MNTITCWILGLLIFGLTKSQELNQFPQNFEVVGRDAQTGVTLTCNTKTQGSVVWKFRYEEGEEEEVTLGDNVKQEGLNLTILHVDERGDIGEYSCWRGPERLSSVHLLLEANDNDESGFSFHCWAKSYDCNFSCRWTASGPAVVRMGLGPDCSERRRSCQWHSSSSTDGGFQVELSHSLSAYTEESTMLEVTAEAIQDSSFIRKSKKFYLRDIIQPDSPSIVHCQEVEQGLRVTIEAPPSWSTPLSFFSLEHQIEYELKDNAQRHFSSSPVIPRRVSQLRVRSKDGLVMSAWSQWTPWKNVGKRRNNTNMCKRKRMQKKCRQQWGPGLRRLREERKTKRIRVEERKRRGRGKNTPM